MEEVPQNSTCVECQNSGWALDSCLVFPPGLCRSPSCSVLVWSCGWPCFEQEIGLGDLPVNPSCFMMMLLKASPVENICACVAEDCDAQGWASVGWRELSFWCCCGGGGGGGEIQPPQSQCCFSLECWWPWGHLDSSGLAAAAATAPSSTLPCLCLQQRQWKGPVAAPEPALCGCAELDLVSADPLQLGR